MPKNTLQDHFIGKRQVFFGAFLEYAKLRRPGSASSWGQVVDVAIFSIQLGIAVRPAQTACLITPSVSKLHFSFFLEKDFFFLEKEVL